MTGTIIEPKIGTFVTGPSRDGVRCDTCDSLRYRAEHQKDGKPTKYFTEGDECPKCKANARPLWIRQLEHHKDSGVLNTVLLAWKNKTPVLVKRSDGSFTECVIKELASGVAVYVRWDRPGGGKGLQKKRLMHEFVEENPTLFAHIEDPVGPTE